MSSVPEALAALSTIFTTALPNSQVIEGEIGSEPPTSKPLALIGDEEFDVEREPDSLGGNTATERYTIPCAVRADLQTPDQALADAQAWGDYEAIENALEAQPDLGLSATIKLSAMITNPQFRRRGDSDGRHALVRFGIDVFAPNS